MFRYRDLLLHFAFLSPSSALNWIHLALANRANSRARGSGERQRIRVSRVQSELGSQRTESGFHVSIKWVRLLAIPMSKLTHIAFACNDNIQHGLLGTADPTAGAKLKRFRAQFDALEASANFGFGEAKESNKRTFYAISSAAMANAYIT